MTDYLKQGAPMPPSLGGCADLYHDIRELRLAMEKEIEPFKAREAEVREFIIENLSKGADTGVAGKRYRAQIVSMLKVNVIDWGVVYAWIRKNDRFDMLQKRLADTAVKDWMEQEDRVLPGTEKLTVPEVSITKI